MSEILDLVNERDEVIGTIEREAARLQGAMVRIVNVWFYTPKGEVILQRRSLKKKVLPGNLTPTVSGHVPSGMSYRDTAVKEIEEETGVRVKTGDLIDLGPLSYDSTNGVRWSGRFIYLFTGAVEELLVEEDEGDGFEVRSLDEVYAMIETSPEVLTPFVVGEAGRGMLEAIETRLG